MNTQPHRNTCKSTLRAAVALAALAAGSALAGPVAYATLPVAGNIQRTAVATQTLTKGGSASPLLGRNGQIPALPPLLALGREHPTNGDRWLVSLDGVDSPDSHSGESA